MQTTLTLPDKKADKNVKIKVSETFCQQPTTNKEIFCEKAEEFYEGFKESINELNEVLAGRKQARPVAELIAELRSLDDNSV